LSQALTILAIVGIAAAGIAYFTNMLCEPFKLCYSGAGAIPLEPGSVTPQQYAEGIAKTIGVQMPNPPVMMEEQPGRKEIIKELQAAGLPPGRPAGSRTKAQQKCAGFKTKSPQLYHQCVKFNASNFAEAESYYVRVA
jgi:hypothetical protein